MHRTRPDGLWRPRHGLDHLPDEEAGEDDRQDKDAYTDPRPRLGRACRLQRAWLRVAGHDETLVCIGLTTLRDDQGTPNKRRPAEVAAAATTTTTNGTLRQASTPPTST